MSSFSEASSVAEEQTTIVNRTGTHAFDNELLEKLGNDPQAITDALYFYNAVKDKSYMWIDGDMLIDAKLNSQAILNKIRTPQLLHVYQSNLYWDGWVTYSSWTFDKDEQLLVLQEATGEYAYPFDEQGKSHEDPDTIHGFIVFG